MIRGDKFSSFLWEVTEVHYYSPPNCFTSITTSPNQTMARFEAQVWVSGQHPYQTEVNAANVFAAKTQIARREGVKEHEVNRIFEIDNSSSSSSSSSSGGSWFSGGGSSSGGGESATLGESLGALGLIAGVIGIIAFWEAIVVIFFITLFGGGSFLGLGMYLNWKEEQEKNKNRPAQVSHKYRTEAFK